MYYVGWVPTITGHLSFTTLATGSFPSKCWRREQGNRLIGVQRRDLLDVLVPFTDSAAVVRFFREVLANHIIGISGRFWYIMDATESDDGETLEGTLFMVPEARRRSYKKNLRKWLAVAQELSGVEEIIDQTRDNCCYSVQFTLERGGKATLSPSEVTQGSKLSHLLANQAFFFLKDISHVHQHHHPTHDAITEVTGISGESDKDEWVKQTQFSLYRAIIRFKRFKNEKALFRAAGVLAYAQSFDKNYGGEGSLAKRFNQEELKDSLAVGREELRHFQTRTLSVSETVRGFFFAAFGLVAATGIFARLGGAQEFEVDQSLITVAQYVASNPWGSVGITALVSFGWAFLTHRIDPSEMRVVRFILRLLQGWRLRWTLLFHVAITVLLLIVSYLLLR